MHFITTMDEYFMNRGTFLECRKFLKIVQDIQDRGDKASERDIRKQVAQVRVGDENGILGSSA